MLFSLLRSFLQRKEQNIYETFDAFERLQEQNSI